MQIVKLIHMGVLVAVILVAFGSGKHEKPAETMAMKEEAHVSSRDTDSQLAYDEVIKDIAAHIGKRVTWIASHATSSSSTNVKTGKKTMTYVYLAQDKEGNFFTDNVFLFSHPGSWKDIRRTPTAEKADNTPYEPGIRKVNGVIAGSAEYKQASGAVSFVPVLEDVSLDIPSDRQSFQILKKYIDVTSNPTWAQHRVDAFVAVYSDSDLVEDAIQLMTKYK